MFRKGHVSRFWMLAIIAAFMFATVRSFESYNPIPAHATAWHYCYDAGYMEKGSDEFRNCVNMELARAK